MQTLHVQTNRKLKRNVKVFMSDVWISCSICLCYCASRVERSISNGVSSCQQHPLPFTSTLIFPRNFFMSNNEPRTSDSTDEQFPHQTPYYNHPEHERSPISAFTLHNRQIIEIILCESQAHEKDFFLLLCWVIIDSIDLLEA